MFTIPVQYQLSYFADTTDVRPSAPVIAPLLQELSEWSLLPSTLQELSPPIPMIVARLQFSSPNGDLQVQFASDRINVARNASDPRGDRIGSLGEFTNQSIAILSRVLKLHPKKATRLALQVSLLSGELGDAALARAFRSLFNPVSVYAEVPPLEWSQRSLSRIRRTFGDASEPVNVITTVGRFQGQFLLPQQPALDFDRLQLGFDLNTHQDNHEQRFSIASATAFIADAQSLVSTMKGEIEERLDDKRRH